MTNETIDKYLDKQGVKKDIEDSYYLRYCTSSKEKVVDSEYENMDLPLPKTIKNSRKSLRDWIMVACERQCPVAIRMRAERNIEASLGKPWAQVRAELEGME